jgi:hypothetical protein
MKKIRCKEWKEYQHYKKNNKNYSKEQPWFRMFGRKLIGERKYMELKPEERDFLVTGCWCIGSQDNGFLPSPEDIAFKMRIELKEVNLHLKLLLQQDWLEEYAEEDYKKIMNDVHKQVEENQRENGLAKVKKESVHEEAQRLTKKMSINNS